MASIPTSAAVPTADLALRASNVPVPPGSPPSPPPGGLAGWMQSQPAGTRVAIGTLLGAAVAGGVGLVFGPIGGLVGAAAGGLLAFGVVRGLVGLAGA